MSMKRICMVRSQSQKILFGINKQVHRHNNNAVMFAHSYSMSS